MFGQRLFFQQLKDVLSHPDSPRGHQWAKNKEIVMQYNKYWKPGSKHLKMKLGKEGNCSTVPTPVEIYINNVSFKKLEKHKSIAVDNVCYTFS